MFSLLTTYAPAAVRVGEDHLPIGRDDDGQEHAHHDRDWDELGQAQRQARRAQRGDEEDLFGGVGRRRQRVRREHRQCDGLGEPLLLHLGGGQWPPDEEPLEYADHPHLPRSACHLARSRRDLSTVTRQSRSDARGRRPVARDRPVAPSAAAIPNWSASATATTRCSRVTATSGSPSNTRRPHRAAPVENRELDTVSRQGEPTGEPRVLVTLHRPRPGPCAGAPS